MKRVFNIVIWLCLLTHLSAQIELINVYEQNDYGELKYIEDFEVYEGDYIIAGHMVNDEIATPVVMRVDTKGNVLWTTIQQSSKRLPDISERQIDIFISRENILYASVGFHTSRDYFKELWSIDLESGILINNKEFYQTEDDYPFEFKDYNEDLFITSMKGSNNFNSNEFAFIDKMTLNPINKTNIGTSIQIAKFDLDYAKNIFVGLANKIMKYNKDNLSNTLWEITLDNSLTVLDFHTNSDSELFIFTWDSEKEVFLNKVDPQTGNLIWTSNISMDNTLRRYFLGDFIEDENYIYSTFSTTLTYNNLSNHIYVSKINKNTGKIEWEEFYDIPEGGPNEIDPSFAAGLSMELDCDSNLYLTGFFNRSENGGSTAAILKVSAFDGDEIWGKCFSSIPNDQSTESSGLDLHIQNDTVIVLVTLNDGLGDGTYIAMINPESGETEYLQKIQFETCEFPSVNHLVSHNSKYYDASSDGNNVIFSEYRTGFNDDIETNKIISIYGDKYEQKARYAYKDDYTHIVSSISKNPRDSTTTIFTNYITENLLSLRKRDSIIINSLDSELLQIFGGEDYAAVLYKVDQQIRLKVYFYYHNNNFSKDILLEEENTIFDIESERSMIFKSEEQFYFFGRDAMDSYSFPSFFLFKEIPYSSDMDVNNHALIADTSVCIVGNNMEGEIILRMMDLRYQEKELWSYNTSLKGTALQVVFDNLNGIYISGITDNHLYIAKYNIHNGELVWQFNNPSLSTNTTPLDMAIIPERNTIAIACKKKQTLTTSEGLLLILNLQGNIVHFEKYVDEIDAVSSVNTVIAGQDSKYYFGGSHNTMINGKQGFVRSADFTSVDESFGIFGNVYYDENRNGLRDAEELGLPNTRIKINPFSESILTDRDGNFFRLAEEGTLYAITTDIDTSIFDLTTDSISYQLEYDTSIQTNFDFGYYAPLEEDINVNLTSDPTRCNTDARFYLQVTNDGYLLNSITVSLDYDSNVQFLTSLASPFAFLEDENKLIWKFEEVLPFETINFPIEFMMPNEQNTGLVMNFKVNIETEQSGLLETYEYTPTVLCSYDPNDKLVMPAGHYEENYTLFGDSLLTYTVRFQNTGNASAIDVAIRDTFDMNLDMSTFKVINASHSLRTTIDNRNVEFMFKDIYLIDSLTNEPESHGQVTYEIKLNPELDNNTLIENTASIFFDFNPPIVTNTIQNLMVDMLPVMTSTSETKELEIFSLFPNPTNDILFIKNSLNLRVDQIMIYDIAGRLVKTTKEMKISTEKLESGYYLLVIESENSSTTLNFLKM